jgi:hypothetical protein
MASRRVAPLDSSRSVTWLSSSSDFGGPSVSDLRQFYTSTKMLCHSVSESLSVVPGVSSIRLRL